MRLNRVARERTTLILGPMTIRDLDGAALGASALDTLTLTLHDECTQAIINEREAQDVLNVNGGEVTEAGVFTLRLDPDDTVILDDDNAKEWHVALLTWTWTVNSVEYTGRAEIKHRVKNLGVIE